MPGVELEFTVLEDGTFNLKIKGIRGAACKPIHAAVSADLEKALGVGELSAVDTDEGKDRYATYSAPPRVTSS